MNKIEKQAVVAELTETLNGNDFVYLADTTGLTANQTNKLRRMLFEKGVTMRMVKNTLINRAMNDSDKDFGGMESTLAGTTCLLTSDSKKAPAEAIKKFRESSPMPLLKGAWIENSIFIGDAELETVLKLRSKEELIGEIISLLQSPAKNVISALQNNAGNKLAALVKAIEDKKN